MKTLTKLFEDRLFNAQTAPTYYRNRTDLLKPASLVFPKDEFKVISKLIIDDSTMGTKGAQYFMSDSDKVVSLIVSEQPSKRYVLTFSTTGNANDFSIGLGDYDQMINFINALGIKVEDFVKSNLNPKKVL